MLLRAAVLAALLLAAPAMAQDAGYRVIVHPSNPGTLIKRPVLSGIFMGKTPRWGDGAIVSPVDQSAQSGVRARFVRDVMNDSVASVMAYWARQVVSGGARPPAVKGTDKEVIEFVAGKPGAIGYVSGDTVLPATVKALKVE